MAVGRENGHQVVILEQDHELARWQKEPHMEVVEPRLPAIK